MCACVIRHPEADLLKLAVESLLKDRMKPEGTCRGRAWAQPRLRMLTDS
jgi:hypothetical protein